jgi:hypothetical protein
MRHAEAIEIDALTMRLPGASAVKSESAMRHAEAIEIDALTMRLPSAWRSAKGAKCALFPWKMCTMCYLLAQGVQGVLSTVAPYVIG